MSNHRKLHKTLDNSALQEKYGGGWGDANPDETKNLHFLSGGWGDANPTPNPTPNPAPNPDETKNLDLLGGGWGDANPTNNEFKNTQLGGWPGSMDELFMCRQKYTLNKIMYQKLCNH